MKRGNEEAVRKNTEKEGTLKQSLAEKTERSVPIVWVCRPVAQDHEGPMKEGD